MNPFFYSDYPVLIVDDEAEVSDSFELILNSGGVNNTFQCRDSRKVIPMLENIGGFEVILLDLIMPHLSGKELLSRLCERYPEIPVIVITAIDDLENAVQCMKAGAFDYIVKPVEKLRLISSVKIALERQNAARENRALKKRILTDTLEHHDVFEKLITKNSAMIAVFKYIEAIAASSEPVLITGETGVGKELIAKAVHRINNLQGPFIGVNIAGLDDHSFSDVLFGHRKGAFTGADSSRMGLLEKAEKGTLFLDEIGDLNAASQIKLLRLLQEREYYTLGSDLPKQSHARIIAASNRHLSSTDTQNSFRRDLFYRLQTHQIHLPPLRERMEDLPLLVKHFVEKSSDKLGKKPPVYPQELISLLKCHNFPGNVRELEGMIFDAVSKNRTGFLSLDTFKSRIFKDDKIELPNACVEGGETIFSSLKSLPTLEEANWQLIREALGRSDGNQSIASRFLGISQPALSRRLKYNKKKNP